MNASMKSCDAMQIIQVAEGMAALLSAGKKKHFINTSIKGLQNACGGLCGGKLYVFGARPSVGKTAIGVQLAIDAAQDGAHAVYFSTESDKETMTARILANIGQFDSFDIERGLIGPKALVATAGRIPPKLLIADKSPVIWAMLSFMRRWRAENKGPAVFFVDYLELVSYPKAPSIQERVSEVISLLQQASKELDVAMVVMSQLNRSTATDDTEPELHHLRSSGMVEQAADFAGLLFRDKSGQLWLKIAKNRISGRLCRIALQMEAKYSRLSEGVSDGATVPKPSDPPYDF
jgi:replicative DNA helicase